MRDKKVKIQIVLVASIIGLFIVSCKVSQKVQKTSDNSYLPVKKSLLIENPFGYEGNIKNFTKNLVPPFNIQYSIVKNKHYPTQNDTIVKFYKGKSELLVYKTKYKKEIFFSGNIFYKGIVLKNGVHVGMNRSEFFKSFSDLKYTLEDKIKVSMGESGGSYTFVFKKDKLESINIQYYID
jgi:hypothetical protein